MENFRGIKVKNLIKKYIKLKNPKVLDVGCGENNLFFNFRDYIGIDIRDYGTPFKVISMNLNEETQLPFKDNSFDVVLATEILEHIFRPDLLAKEINRVVRRNGLIVISLPNEFTLNCRIGFMFNRVLNKGFDMYSHKYIFNIDKLDEFVRANFNPIDKDLVCYGHIWKDLPDGIKDFMAHLSPSFFAKSVIYACQKV